MGLKVEGGQSVIPFIRLFQRLICGSRFQPLNSSVSIVRLIIALDLLFKNNR